MIQFQSQIHWFKTRSYLVKVPLIKGDSRPLAMGKHSRFMYPAARINPKYHRQRLIRLSSLIQKLCTTVEGLQHPLGKYLASAYALNLMLYYRPKKGLDVMLVTFSDLVN